MRGFPRQQRGCLIYYPILDNEVCGNLRDDTGDGRIDEGCPRDDAPTVPPHRMEILQEWNFAGDGRDNDNDGNVDEGCGINSGLGSQFGLNPATGICFACVEDDTDAGPPPQQVDDQLTTNGDPNSALQ